jgi:hypothetical protein
VMIRVTRLAAGIVFQREHRHMLRGRIRQHIVGGMGLRRYGACGSCAQGGTKDDEHAAMALPGAPSSG